MSIKLDGSDGIVYSDGSVEKYATTTLQINPDFGAGRLYKDTYPYGITLTNDVMTKINIGDNITPFTTTGSISIDRINNRVFAPVAGYYRISASMGVVTVDQSFQNYVSKVNFYINLNGQRYEQFGDWDTGINTASLAIIQRNGSCIHYLPVNGYVELYVKATGGPSAQVYSYINALSFHCIRPTS